MRRVSASDAMVSRRKIGIIGEGVEMAMLETAPRQAKRSLRQASLNVQGVPSLKLAWPAGLAWGSWRAISVSKAQETRWQLWPLHGALFFS